jgi:hypothetical protein
MKVFLKRDDTKNWLLWWGTTPANIKYPIPEKRIQASLDPEPVALDQKLQKFRERMNRIYKGSVEEFQGEYSYTMKTLTLKA